MIAGHVNIVILLESGIVVPVVIIVIDLLEALPAIVVNVPKGIVQVDE
jgi:hypothetical protein